MTQGKIRRQRETVTSTARRIGEPIIFRARNRRSHQDANVHSRLDDLTVEELRKVIAPFLAPENFSHPGW
jgi:hypothetical protein